MNVKLQIKEVKEDTRPIITLEEKCMFLLSTDMHYSQKIRDEIRKRLDALGLLIRVDSENIVFLTETIRDATPEEVIAWHCTQIKKECDMIGGSECAKCPKHLSKIAGCIASSDYVKSMAILEGKIVSVEYIEE